ncbi:MULTISPECIES: double-strand break repair helicase AddA [unclassified Roseovarius]|uniref:double-strand break repair helicase AddA n=1 Tax=unclassified Roseovarius TaxID=2614913 RepID=UPI00273F9B11|nr:MULTISPECIES: double-strand break repair helicase AddA [unclassified Roseovarius]
MTRDAATQRQIDAAQPGRSTWLSANAGSGKTRVLTDRVARLLLEGVEPQNILCLTYTKAAASEMQNRLFKRLGEWAMLSDPELTGQLVQLGLPGGIGGERLQDARRLFARAIETPGGLKIQTIHSFCAALLRRFPLEAGVSPQFTEMDDRAATLLRAEIVEEIADGAEAHRLETVARYYSGDSFEDLTAEIVRHRSRFEEGAGGTDFAAVFGQPNDLTPEGVADTVFLGSERALLNDLIPALSASGVNDQKAADKLQTLTMLDAEALPVLESVFLTGAGAKDPFSAKIGSFPTKNCRAAIAGIMPQIEAFMQRVEDAREARLACDAIAKTKALHAFAAEFLPAYHHAKQLRGWLDFDDLILRARDLLVDPQVAAWVLFRLDGGIDHILVDEAQDTSPVQWQVIERLAQEFTSGHGSRSDRPRTIFVVGDKKQSIYSFQGADPNEFDRMQADFAARLKDTGTPLQQMEMEYSFRSSQAILSLVDQTFKGAEKSGFSPEQGHKAHKSNLPGRVDLWPYVAPPEAEEKPPWHTPVDVKSANDPSVVLARQIATEIKRLVGSGHPIPSSDPTDGKHRSKPAQPGDFLILVQRRSDLFHEIIRECKALDLPIAGADRLKVGAEIAVRDLAALLSFLALPEDSYSLAVALKSPLFGWSEGSLYDLAQGRAARYLWRELDNRAADFPDTIEILRDLRDHADFLRPYDLIERILTRHGGRHRLLSRLGPEAGEGIDALLSQAMSYEQKSVDSLTGFLVWLESDDMEIKRQMDAAGNRVRVMTVHGAKGLEAPVVILPDTGKRTLVIRDQIIASDDTALWRSAADAAPRQIIEAVDKAKEEQIAERDRLLYVAMTRAEKWLIVAAAGEKGNKGETWYEKIEAGMNASGAMPFAFAEGQGLRLEYGDWAEIEPNHVDPKENAPVTLDPFFGDPARPAKAAPKTLSPSELGGAKALADEYGLDEEAAKRRGRQIHRLLEFLPQVGQPLWSETAGYLLAHGTDAATGAELDALLSEAAHVLTSPALSHLFADSTLAEVPITANLAALGGRRIHGTIDRLVLTPDEILAVDFKTNAVVPDTPNSVPDGILRQLGAYAHALGQIYPDRRIATAILWTRTAQLMSLPHDLVTDALNTTQIS